jgi:uncharacterized protein
MAFGQVCLGSTRCTIRSTITTAWPLPTSPFGAVARQGILERLHRDRFAVASRGRVATTTATVATSSIATTVPSKDNFVCDVDSTVQGITTATAAVAPDAMVAATKRWIETIVVRQRLCPFVQPLRSSNTLRITVAEEEASTADTLSGVVDTVVTEIAALLEQPVPPKLAPRPNLDDETADGLDSSDSDDESDGMEEYTDIDDDASDDWEEDDTDDDDDDTGDESVKSNIDLDDSHESSSSSDDSLPIVVHKPRATIVILHGPLVQTYRDFKQLWVHVMRKAVHAHSWCHDVDVWMFHPRAVHQVRYLSTNMPNAAVDYTIRSPYPVLVLLRDTDWQYFGDILSVHPPLEPMSEANQARFRAQGLKVCHQRLQDCYTSTNSPDQTAYQSDVVQGMTTQRVRAIRRNAIVRRGKRNLSTLVQPSLLVAATQKWIERVVVGEKLCPFAPALLAADTLRVVVSPATSETQAVAAIRSEARLLFGADEKTQLDENYDVNASDIAAISPPLSQQQRHLQPRHETTLVVFDAPFVQDFRDFVRLSWVLQEEAIVHGGFQNDLQLVLFHPNATHQTYRDSASLDEGDEAAGDFTIRSPYPTVHLLREIDVMQAASGGYPNLSELPTRNKLRLVAQGYAHCKGRLDECYRSESQSL